MQMHFLGDCSSASMSTLLLVVSVLVGCLVHLILKRKKFNEKLNYPGPKPLPILGNALEFKTTQDIIPVLNRMHKEFGSILKVFIGPDNPSLHITDYDFLEFILGSPKIITKSKEYRFFHRWLGMGLLTSTGTKWHKRRKFLTPAFHFQIVEQFVDVFNRSAEILAQKLLKETENDKTDVYPYITLCALDIICETAMGISVKAQENEESEYVQSVKEICRIIVDRGISPFKIFDCLYYFSKDYRKEKQYLKVLHETTDGVIKKRRHELLTYRARTCNNEDTGKKNRLAFLDLLILSNVDGQSLSDSDIREEVDTFMFEGHDTTSSGIAFALYNLSKHLDIQKKVYEELEEIFEGDMLRNPSYKDLQNMKYLELVIKESLRLYPPVPFFIRHLDEDIEYNGDMLPKDLDIFCYAFGIHRDPKFYPNPDDFIPERFAPEKKLNKKPYAYIPFSAGPRNCIGQKFAMMEMKCVISKIIRNFILRPVPGFEPKLSTELILKSANGLFLTLRNRSNNNNM